MKKAGRRRRKARNKNKTGMLVIGGVALLLLCVFVVQGQSLQKRLLDYDEKLTTLQAQVEEETKRTEDIEDIKKYMETDEYIESVAREKLGLVKENEIVFREAE